MPFNIEGGFNTLNDTPPNVDFIYRDGAIIKAPDDSDFFQLFLNVGKTEVIGIDVTDWAAGETITSITVTSPDASVSIVETDISGGLLLARVTGALSGVSRIVFNYETATRQDCFAGRICVEGDC